ncbi:LppP/LprE family lipoprotein [Actinomyces marmotae]|uniref:LppP/LprE family lipoprotein n=1 Tax=Actinomyces marmotae TaxID=2737173 RepID=A0A6M8BAL0_9ACTO|nr:LppP/LprE family lipoprotein [Actinomyces marmotae]QKD80313.1 LppP/LprE family lipoprotein [Actinomyces marmotae]
MPRSSALAPVGALLLALALTACGGGATGTAPASGGAASTANASEAGAQPPQAPTEQCAAMGGATAVAGSLDEVPAPPAGMNWSPGEADLSTYDRCAPLSWVTLPVHGATASSPYQIMLFHHGEYVGTASLKSYGFKPAVERIDDATIQATYTWPKDGESNAGASGRSVSTFTWDDASGSVTHSGEWPPSAG